MSDSDLARFYGVSTKRLNEQVKPNRERNREDFVFQLTAVEKVEVVAICDHLGKFRLSQGLPYTCTEHGALMAASVLSSARAVERSVFVVRAFVKLRRNLAGHRELSSKPAQLEKRLGDHDQQISPLMRSIEWT